MTENQPQITSELIKQGKLKECDCGSVLFETNVSAVMQVSKLVALTPNDLDIPIRLLVCKECGLVPEWSDPDNVLPKKIKTKYNHGTGF